MLTATECRARAAACRDAAAYLLGDPFPTRQRLALARKLQRDAQQYERTNRLRLASRRNKK